MTRKTISDDQPALAVDSVVKRFNAVSEPWWRRKQDTTNGQSDQPLKARRDKELITAVEHVSFTVQPRRIFGGDSPGAWAQHTDNDVHFAIQQLDLRPGDRILDLGCGWGRHSLPLANYGLHVTGLDLSADLLTLARCNAQRHNLSINWIEADIAHLPLRGCFDAIVQFCGNLMTWFPSSERTLEVLWNVANLLRPGGRLLLGTEDWQPELPPRSQHWDEWQGGAAIYRQRYDQRQRLSTTQTVVFGPEHERHEYRRETWWPSHHDMERLFAQAGLTVCERYNGYGGEPFDPGQNGLVYVLAREGF